MAIVRSPRARCLTCGRTGDIVVRGRLEDRVKPKTFRPACGFFTPGRFMGDSPADDDADMAIVCACGSADVEGERGSAFIVNLALAKSENPQICTPDNVVPRFASKGGGP